MSDNPNLLLICIDCLRSDLFHENEAETPFLDRLQNQSVCFSNMYTTATTTTPAVASFLTGTYSETNGIHSLRKGRLTQDVETLAERLSAYGYETHAAVTGPLTKETGINRGFDTYQYREPTCEVVGEYKSELIDIIARSEEPYFIYAHLWELHHPVDVSSDFESRRYGRIPYEQKISELDRTIKQVVKSTGDDTIVAIIGDHGEGLTWRGTATQYVANRLRTRFRFKSGIDTRKIEQILNILLSKFSIDIQDHPIENGHGKSVYDFVSQVPFLIHNTDIRNSQQKAQCRHVDVLPTVLELLNIEYSDQLDGESLLPIDELEQRPAYVRSCGSTLHGEQNWSRAIRSQNYKYIEYPNRDWSAELYDLSDDSSELIPVREPEVMNDLSSELPRQRLDEGEELNNEERLKQLGYL